MAAKDICSLFMFSSPSGFCKKKLSHWDEIFFQMLSFFFFFAGGFGLKKREPYLPPPPPSVKKMFSSPSFPEFLLSFFGANRLQEELSSFLTQHNNCPRFFSNTPLRALLKCTRNFQNFHK